VSSQLIAGYKALHECGLLVPNLPQTQDNIAKTYCQLIFNHIDDLNPSKQTIANRLLGLSFDLGLDHFTLVDLLLVCLFLKLINYDFRIFPRIQIDFWILIG
jgi:hypothetical protein